MEVSCCVERPVWRDHALEPFQLVIEGGGMCGSAYTAGATDFLLDKGLCAQSVIGVSAGAITGFNYATGALGRTCFYNLKYSRDPRYVGVLSFLTSGNAFGTQFVLDEIPNKIEPIDYRWFTESPIELTTVASDVDRGVADYHLFDHGGDMKKGMRYLAASSSMPMANRMVEIDGKRLLDGGVCDSVPFAYGKEHAGLKQIIVLTRPESYVRPPSKVVPFARVRYFAHPEFVNQWANRHVVYNAQYREAVRLQDVGEAVLIRPHTMVDASLLERDPNHLLGAYEEGYRNAAEQWENIQRFLGL